MATNKKIKMEASRLTPEIICDGGIAFRIPLYQRLFAWTRKEVSGLLLDLKNHFDKREGAYYLGVVITIPDDTRLSLVDGQQRLTVLMLMAACFQKDDVTGRWAAFFDSGKRLKLYARDEDAAYLLSLASPEGAKSGKYENILMRDAFAEITKFTESLGEEKLAFYNNCFERITIFNSRLPESYDRNPASLNEYFEVMNSSGVNLEQHEVLKVSLLNGQSKDSQERLLKIWNLCADFSRPILSEKEEESETDYSNRYVGLFNLSRQNAPEAVEQIENQINLKVANTPTEFPTIAEIDIKHYDFSNRFADDRERSVLTFPEFLLLSLSLFIGQKQGALPLSEWEFFKTDKLLSRFGDYLPVDDVESFYDFMLQTRIALDTFVIRKKTDGTDSEYNLVLTSGPYDINHNCLRQFEGMLSVSTPYYRWLSALLSHVITSADALSTESLLNLLKSADNDAHPLPDSSELTYENVDRYWFWRLDYYLWEQVVAPKEEEESENKEDGESENNKEVFGLRKSPFKEAVRAYVFRANRSIEHLHPQNQANNDEWLPADVNSFGNLAMISQGFNSEQSNDDVHVKFSRIESHIRTRSLQSIKLLAMYLKAKQNPGEWTREAMNCHLIDMMGFLKQSY